MDVALMHSTEDPKVVAAKDIIAAWCRIHQCAAADIPAMADNKRAELDVGILAYTIRTRIGLDMIPLAEMLGIVAGHMLALRNRAGKDIARKDSHVYMRYHDLAVAAGFAKAPEKKLQCTASRAGVLARAQKNAQYAARLNREGDAVINAVIMLLGDRDRERVMGGSTISDYVAVRYIIIAVLFHHVTERHNMTLVGSYLHTTATTVTNALRSVRNALRSDTESSMKRSILLVCDAMRIDPLKLKW